MSESEENGGFEAGGDQLPRAGKMYYPSDDNKSEIKSKAYWAGFKCWILVIVLGAFLWMVGEWGNADEYPQAISVVTSINEVVFPPIIGLVGLIEPSMEVIQDMIYGFETNYSFEIFVAAQGLLGLIVLWLLPYVFYPMYYPWAKKQVALDHHCDACGKDWTVYWTGEKSLFKTGKSYTNSTETENELFGNRERTVDKQQEYKDSYYKYEWLCEHCGDISYRQGVESTLSNETVTARSNWQHKKQCFVREFQGSGENVEGLAHEILKDVLDAKAPVDEVFKCSVEKAVSAVEEAIGRLGGTGSTLFSRTV